MSYSHTEFIYPYEKDLLNINTIRFKALNDEIFKTLEYLTVKYKCHLTPLAKGSMFFKLDLVDKVIPGYLPHPFRICVENIAFVSDYNRKYTKESWINAAYLIRTTPLFFTKTSALESHNFRNKLYKLIYGEDINVSYETIGDNDFLHIYNPNIASIDEISKNIMHTSYRYNQSFRLLARHPFERDKDRCEVQCTGFNRTICHDPDSRDEDYELYDYIEPLPLDAYKDVKDVVMKSVLSMFHHLLYEMILPVEKWRPYKPDPHPDVVHKYSDRGYTWEDEYFHY